MLSDASVSETEDSADEDVEDDEVADEDDEVSEELLELDAGSESGLEQPTSRRAAARSGKAERIAIFLRESESSKRNTRRLSVSQNESACDVL